MSQETRKQCLTELFDQLAAKGEQRSRWTQLYHNYLATLVQRLVPARERVLELGCGTGALLAGLHPKQGVGVDISPNMIDRATAAHPGMRFLTADVEELELDETFDTVVAVNLVGLLDDVFSCLKRTREMLDKPDGRLVLVYYNHLWEPLLRLAARLGLRTPVPHENWLPLADMGSLLQIAGYDVVRSGKRMLCPFYVPIVSHILNTYISPLPGIQRLGLVEYVIARPTPEAAPPTTQPSCSIVIPTRNEKGNIEDAIRRTEPMGRHTEYIFIDGHSTDGTIAEIERVIRDYPERDIQYAQQDGTGKADAVRKGFAMASGDILMILDSDLTMPPEDLPKYFDVLSSGRAEFVNGCRLVYPMEAQAMRALNKIANHAFGKIFSWLMEQPVRDTLCGTKVLRRSDYLKITQNRSYFGDFDPFGDFDLLFGAARLNLKIVDLPIRYRARTYGEIKIHRFRHGLLLIRMSLFGARKLKFF